MDGLQGLLGRKPPFLQGDEGKGGALRIVVDEDGRLRAILKAGGKVIAVPGLDPELPPILEAEKKAREGSPLEADRALHRPDDFAKKNGAFAVLRILGQTR